MCYTALGMRKINKKPNQEFREKIVELREKGVRIKPLAEAMGVTDMAVFHWMRGTRKIPKLVLLFIDDLLKKKKPNVYLKKFINR